MVKRSDVTAILKTHGLRNLRYSNGDVLRRRGKMVRAIPVASHSPMDATSAATARAESGLSDLVHDLETDLDLVLVSRSREHAVLKGDKIELEVRIEEFPSYPLSAGMDPHYTQSAVVAEYRHG